MRLFVAVDLPDELADAVEAVQDRLRDAAGLRFTDPAQAHVTLKFLGDVPDPADSRAGAGDSEERSSSSSRDAERPGDADTDRLPELRDAIGTAVDDADAGPFRATVAGLGAFPSAEYIRVVWAGVDAGAEEMSRLHEAVERETTALGFDPADHEFTPHATLARMSDARGKEHVQRLLREADPTVGSFRVEQIRLKKSVSTDDGPRYSTVARFDL